MCVCPLPPNYTSSTFVLGNEEQSRNQIRTVIQVGIGVGGETLTCFSLKEKIVLFFVGLPRNGEVSSISSSSPPGRRIIFLLSLLNHYLSPAKIDYSPWDNDSPSFPLLITVIINIHVTN